MKRHFTQSEKDLFTLGLPKWPQMKVTGLPVSISQAKEIIRRTDSYFGASWTSGNDRSFDAKWKKIFLCSEKDTDQLNLIHHLSKRVHTAYVRNNWISSCEPRGWCYPDGQIYYTHNIGKYPEIEDVFSDWQSIAEAFPYLDVGVTLMSDEEHAEPEPLPVVSFVVKNGVVFAVDPREIDVHRNHPRRTGALQVKSTYTGRYSYEHAIPIEWLKEYAEYFARIQKLLILK